MNYSEFVGQVQHRLEPRGDRSDALYYSQVVVAVAAEVVGKRQGFSRRRARRPPAHPVPPWRA